MELPNPYAGISGFANGSKFRGNFELFMDPYSAVNKIIRIVGCTSLDICYNIKCCTELTNTELMRCLDATIRK